MITGLIQHESSSPTRTILKGCDDVSWCRIAILRDVPIIPLGLGKTQPCRMRIFLTLIML